MNNFLAIADSCDFISSGFEQTLEKAGAGDMVFCDPPFEPLPDKDGFVKYTKDGFNFDAQERMLGCLVSERQGGLTSFWLTVVRLS